MSGRNSDWLMKNTLVIESNIRKGKSRPATPTTPVSRSGESPGILKRGGLESSGRIASS